MDAPPASWYPDPQQDGMLRWWDGERWTEFVQPARAAGKPVLGEEVTGGMGPVTYYAPGETITHAFPPLTDARYADSPLAELLSEAARDGDADVQVSAAHQAAVEAVHQLRTKGGLLGAIAGLGEELLVDALRDALPARGREVAPDERGVVAYGASRVVPKDAPSEDSLT